MMCREDIFLIRGDFTIVTKKLQVMFENYRTVYTNIANDYIDQLKDFYDLLTDRSSLPSSEVKTEEFAQLESKVIAYEYGVIINPSWLSPKIVLGETKNHELLKYYAKIRNCLDAILKAKELNLQFIEFLTKAQAPDYIQKFLPTE